MGDLKYIPFEEESEDIKPKVTEYWTQRADSFFIQKQHELESDKSLKWKREIIQKISEAYGDSRELNILDVGCGVSGKRRIQCYRNRPDGIHDRKSRHDDRL